MPAHDPELSRAAVQTLFVSARAWDVTALLRELKESTGRWQKVKLENFILGLLEFGKGCPALGLKLTIEGGRVDLSTTTITGSAAERLAGRIECRADRSDIGIDARGVGDRGDQATGHRGRNRFHMRD